MSRSKPDPNGDPNVDPDIDAYVDPDTEERDDTIIGVALRWSLAAMALLAVAVVGAAYVLTRPEPAPPVQETVLADVEVREAPVVEVPQMPFTDVTGQAGITFVHENGAAGEKLLPETMGGGCAFFDFDGDGDQDLLLVNSQQWPWDTGAAGLPEDRTGGGTQNRDPGTLSRSAATEDPPVGDASQRGGPTMALYANDGAGRFEDVTDGSGLDVSLYGMGVACGDYDNDGRVDVFLSALGPNRLFHNEGNGRFRDVTGEAGVAGDAREWASSSGWFDYDRDGDLDLFVCNYLKWSREYDVAQNFQLTGGGRAYGRPQNFEGTFPYLYRNDGGGTFTDVTEQAGLQVRNPATNVPMAKSLGVVFADFDADGWPDIVVANDTVQNFLFHNQQDGTFREIGAISGVAFDMDGSARGAMGIDVARFRNSDAVGIAIGNFSNEMTALYVAENRRLLFLDEAISTGLGPTTRLQLTFGLFYFDCDLDGRLDLFAANGHLEDEINRVQPSQHYEQPPQLFWNCGPEQATEYVPVSAAHCGEDLLRPMVGRGAAYADIDGDGDLDVLITAVGKPPRLLRNDQQLGHHWLRVKLRGRACSRDAIGAWVAVTLADRVLHQQVMPTRSYLSQVELPVTFGLGDEERVQAITVSWPDGTVQELSEPSTDRLHEIEQQSAPTLTLRQESWGRSQRADDSEMSADR